MDRPQNARRFALSSNNLFFLLLLLSSNLLTLFLSTTFYSSCSLQKPQLKLPTTTTTPPLPPEKVSDVDSEEETSSTNLPSEFIAFTSPQQLPFGFNKNFDSDEIFPPVGRPCTVFQDDLRRYMNYQINGSCPDDEILAQKLLLRGCEPLPRRRCAPPLWTTPPDSSVVWTAYTCKNYSCLINRMRNQKGFDDCKDCFDLNGREKDRWTSKSDSDLDFSIDDVLNVVKPGTIRIGLDLGGGVATFAVRMRKRNITILTTSMNLNGPFNNFIASRGVVPLYLSISQRLPFFDNTLDIVHSMHVLSNWIPVTLMHFLIFDIYRVLRPGGLFWLDHFFWVGDQFEMEYKPLIESVGFNKVKWVVGRKLDRGPELNEMYLSALLEKPLKNSW
ncbi:hypothetical protein ACJIZ3_002493 [Penstemon smallii]|uniref:S-adenosyl-L-methionine-dependent methyltransferase n=1 Tax=Penstemon smallii TaxID=265156 RepID=A0ABD3U6Y6_9LAMI